MPNGMLSMTQGTEAPGSESTTAEPDVQKAMGSIGSEIGAESPDVNMTAAEAVGVRMNSRHDFHAFVGCTIVNSILAGLFCLFFVVGLKYFPQIYMNNARSEARSMIEENRANIVKNYAAAFVGNRQMACENTDAIMKNRFAILDALKVEGPVQENFLNSKYNEAAIEYLENRSLLNNRVAKANLKMSEANADLIAINDQILKSNEEIVVFNGAQIETNTKL